MKQNFPALRDAAETLTYCDTLRRPIATSITGIAARGLQIAIAPVGTLLSVGEARGYAASVWPNRGVSVAKHW